MRRRGRLELAGSTLFVDTLNLTDAGFLDITGFEEAGAAVRVGLRTPIGG